MAYISMADLGFPKGSSVNYTKPATSPAPSPSPAPDGGSKTGWVQPTTQPQQPQQQQTSSSQPWMNLFGEITRAGAAVGGAYLQSQMQQQPQYQPAQFQQLPQRQQPTGVPTWAWVLGGMAATGLLATGVVLIAK